MKDCIVVGGGPAGLTAALYLARFLRSVAVFDGRNGRARMIPKTHNLAAFPEGISGLDLLALMEAHAEHFGARVRVETVLSVERQDDAFRVITDRRVEWARSVILACGVFNHRPPLSDQDHDAGLIRGLIRYCPICDAYEVRGKRVAVLGSGPHAFDEARFIRGYTPSVTLIALDEASETAREGVATLDAPLSHLTLSGSEVIVTLKSGATHLFDTLYVAMGTTAHTDLAVRLGCGLTGNAHIAVDQKQMTCIDRVYAIGDVTDGLDQIAVAMGQGAIAATAIHNTLPGPVPAAGS